MKPFRVKCVNASPNGDGSGVRLVFGCHYTVVAMERGCYRLSETGPRLWSPGRFIEADKEIDEEMDYWVRRNAMTEDHSFHLVVKGIHDLNTANNLVAALTKQFTECHFEIEGKTEYKIVEHPPSVSSSRRKSMKLFSEGFLAALP